MQKLFLWLENYSKYFLAAVLILVPLYPKFPFVRIPGTYVSIRLEDFLIASLAIFIIPRIGSVIKSKVAKAMSVFLAVGFVSFLSAVFITKTIEPAIGLFHFVRRIEYFIPFLAGYIMLREKNDPREILEFFVKCLMITVLVAFVYGVGQRYFSWPVIITQNEEYSKGIALRWIPGSHVNSTFAGHYDLATFLVLVLPIFIAAFFVLKGKWTRVALATTVFAGLWLLTNAVSRISVVSYLAAAVLSLVLLKKYKQIYLVIFISLVFFMTSQALLGRYLNLSVYAKGENMVEEKEVQVVEDRSTSIRFNVEWPRAIRAFSKNPVLGTGYSSITLATDNDFLRLLGEVGVLGFIAFIILLLKMALTWLKALPIYAKFTGVEAAFLAGVIGSFPGIMLNSFFIDVFEASKFALIFWLLVGLSVFLVEKNINEQNF